MARNRAARYLTASMGEISQLMIREGMSLKYFGENEYDEGTIEHNAFKVISSNYSSLKALNNE